MKQVKMFIFILLSVFISCKISDAELIDLHNSVKEVANLSLSEFVYKDIIFVKESKRFWGMSISKKEVLFSVKIRVVAGIDLDKDFVIKVEKNILYLELPKPEILLLDADEKSLNEYYSKYFGTKVSLLFYYKEIEQQKENLKQESIERGILEDAEKNIREFFEIIYKNAGFDSVKIIFYEISPSKEERLDEKS